MKELKFLIDLQRRKNRMILKYDKFALTPKICDRCKRRFVWEGYKIYIKQVNPMLDIQCIECRECISKWHIDEKKAQEMYERALKVMKDYSADVLDSGI